MQAIKTRELIRPVPATWWLKNPNYTWFMIRELTAVFVAGYAVFLLVLAYHRAAGNEAAFKELLVCRWSLALQVLALVFVLYHAVTWLNLTPKVVIVYRGEEKVPAGLIAGAHYVLWLVVSVVVLLLVL
jgi:fumarate reductase subunit C